MDYRKLTEEFAEADRTFRRGRPEKAPEPRAVPVSRLERLREAERLASSSRRRRRSWWRRARSVLVAGVLMAVGVDVAAAAPFIWYQRTLIYWEGGRPISGIRDSASLSIRRYESDHDDVEFASYVFPGAPDKPTVVYFHGRGEGLGFIEDVAGEYTSRGWTVIAPEYPGFAGLKGRPSERLIGELSDAVYADLSRRMDPRRIAIHGNSLGAGPALQFAQHPHGFLLLTAPVGSLSQVVHSWVPLPLLTLFLADRWDNVARARTRFPAPAEVVQAADDAVVPVSQGRMLAEAAGASFHEYPSGGHLIYDRPRLDWKGGRFSVTP